jgi:rRNA-processing protein EBP2
MALSGERGVAGPEDVNDDLKRETYFYEQALASAVVAARRLRDLGVSVRRPDDFYAEMVKSDEHMKRVRAELVFERTAQETKEERRKAREQKRYGKQVQAEKLKERTLAKKESIKSLDKWRKRRKQEGFADDGAAGAPDGFDDERGDGAQKKRRGGGGGGQHGGSTPESRKKKSFKEEKFGFGGRKRVRALATRAPVRGASARFEPGWIILGAGPFFSPFSPAPGAPRTPPPAEKSRRARGVLPACPDASRKGHLLIHGVYPELKRLRRTPSVVG